MAFRTFSLGKIGILRFHARLQVGHFCCFVLTWFGIMFLISYFIPLFDDDSHHKMMMPALQLKDEKDLLSSSVIRVIPRNLNVPVPIKGSTKRIHLIDTNSSTRKFILHAKSQPFESNGQDAAQEIRTKRDFIKQMMKDAWRSYEKYAWGYNEVRPLDRTPDFTGVFGRHKLGASIVDSLDTLFIMGFHDEYKRARDWVATELNFDDVKGQVSVFETNIRFVGGLLSIYALTGDEMYKEKAYELGKRLLPAFDTPTGIPYGAINLQTGECDTRVDRSSVLSELGAIHLEFVYLSDITGDPVFKDKVLKIRKSLMKTEKLHGLYYNYINPLTGNFTNSHVSMGAGGDSFYEYLLKSYLQNGDLEGREMYDASVEAILESGLIQVSNMKLYFIGILNNGVLERNMEHLSCFAGGMFALGAYTDPSLQKLHNPTSSKRARLYLKIGEEVTRTCHESYIRTATRIGPEKFSFTGGEEARAQYYDRHYKLRPEVIESYFVLWRLTGDKKYRDWAWDAATAIEHYCKVEPDGGYSGLVSVTSTSPRLNDVQESFFMAETLKYLYLIFSSKDFMELDHWVFNTEAHPLPINPNPYYRSS